MPVHPLLFETRLCRQTTREVADLVRESGVDAAMADARRRADDATYKEVSCRSALNRVDGMPFNWTLNPYRGCTHGCHYCFARRYHAQFELDPDDQFASLIIVKRNFIEVLERQLDRPSWSRELVAVGTATDPYQPIEGHYRLTRGTLEALARARTPAGIVTKGPMIVRDIDVLRALGDAAGCTVYMSVPSVDEDAWRMLEPGTAHPTQRLRAVRQLADAGVNAGVLMAPIVPGFTSSASRLEQTIKDIADHGARFVGCNIMYLQDGTREHFMRFLEREFPSLLPRYEKLYAAKYPPEQYRREVKGMVAALQQRYGLRRREDATASQEALASRDAEQVAFRWD